MSQKKKLFRKFSNVYSSTSSHYFICLHHLKLMIRSSSNEYKIFADNFTEHFRERELNFFICWSSLSPWIMIFLRASIIVLLPTFKISYELLLHVSISFLNFIRKFILSFISIQCHTLSTYAVGASSILRFFFLTIHFLNRTVLSYAND